MTYFISLLFILLTFNQCFTIESLSIPAEQFNGFIDTIPKEGKYKNEL